MKKGNLVALLALAGFGLVAYRGYQEAGASPFLGEGQLARPEEGFLDIFNPRGPGTLESIIAAARAAGPSPEYQAAIAAGASPSLVSAYLMSPASQISRAATSSMRTGVATETIMARGAEAGYDISAIRAFLSRTGYQTPEAYMASKQPEWQATGVTTTGEEVAASYTGQPISALPGFTTAQLGVPGVGYVNGRIGVTAYTPEVAALGQIGALKGALFSFL